MQTKRQLEDSQKYNEEPPTSKEAKTEDDESQPRPPTQKLSTRDTTLNFLNEAISMDDLGKFKEYYPNPETTTQLRQQDLLELLANALHAHRVDIVKVILTTKLPRALSKTGCFTEEGRVKNALFLIGIRYACFFDTRELQILRQQFIKTRITLSSSQKDDLLSVIDGIGTPKEKINRPTMPCWTTYAAANNHVDSLKALLEPNKPCDEEFIHTSPVVAALINYAHTALYFLLDRGHELNRVYTLPDKTAKAYRSNIEDGCLLSIAAQIEDIEIFKSLHARGATISNAVMECIVRLGRKEFLEYCLQTIEVVTDHLPKVAARHGQLETLIPLIRKFKDKYPRVRVNGSVLIAALAGRSTSRHVVAYLLHSTDVDITPALNDLIRQDYTDTVIRGLETYPFFANRARWQSALNTAAQYGNREVLTKIKEQGGVVEEFDTNGVNAVFSAAIGGQLSLLQEFVNDNPEVLVMANHRGETLVFYAALSASGNCDVLNFSLSQLREIRQYSDDDIANFLNGNTTNNNTILSFFSRLTNSQCDNLDLLCALEILAKNGLRFFEEVRHERKLSVLCNFPHDIVAPEYMNARQQIFIAAANALDRQEYLPYAYLSYLKMLDQQLNDQRLKRRIEHMMIFSDLFGQLFLVSNIDNSQIVRALNKAIGISCIWTAAAIEPFLKSLVNNDTAIDQCVTALLPLTADVKSHPIRQAAGEACYTIACDFSLCEPVNMTARMRYFFKLAILLLEPDQQETLYRYQTLLGKRVNEDIEDDKEVKQLQREAMELREQFSPSPQCCTEVLKIEFSAALQGNDENLVKFYFETHPQLLVEPLNEMNQLAIDILYSNQNSFSLHLVNVAVGMLKILLDPNREDTPTDMPLLQRASAVLNGRFAELSEQAKHRLKYLTDYSDIITPQYRLFCAEQRFDRAKSHFEQIWKTQHLPHFISQLGRKLKPARIEVHHLLRLCLYSALAEDHPSYNAMPQIIRQLGAFRLVYTLCAYQAETITEKQDAFLNEFIKLLPAAKRSQNDCCERFPQDTLVALLRLRIAVLRLWTDEEFKPLQERLTQLPHYNHRDFSNYYDNLHRDITAELEQRGITIGEIQILKLETRCLKKLYQLMSASSVNDQIFNNHGKRENVPQWTPGLFLFHEQEAGNKEMKFDSFSGTKP